MHKTLSYYVLKAARMIAVQTYSEPGELISATHYVEHPSQHESFMEINVTL